MSRFHAFAEAIAAERRLLVLVRLQFDLVARSYRERKYSPDQPRVPAGSPEGGRWTSRSGSGDTDFATAFGFDTLLGGDGSDPLGADGRDPEPPVDRPPRVAERVGLLKDLADLVRTAPARWLRILEVSTWLARYQLGIESYNDPPRTLADLQDAVADPRPGYHIHHIVEQASAFDDGFSADIIHARENLVRIPAMKHWEITGWYMRQNEEFGNQSPREYVRRRSWSVRYQVGLEALKRFEVLK